MFSWCLEELVTAVSGELILPAGKNSQDYRFSRVTTDSRQISACMDAIEKECKQSLETKSLPGVLYVAICGERFDGHAFIPQVISAGAKVLVVSEVQAECEIPQVKVVDTRIALGEFGRWHRQNMPVKCVVGITGSNGKTTTKTMLAELLKTQGNTLMTQGNLNNDFGVPRTLLELRPEHEFAVVEMGANHLGEIAYLTRLVAPDIALLNNAAGAHLEGFGSLEGVIQAKGEIFEGIAQASDYGVAVINADSPGFEHWLTRIDQLPVKKVVGFASCESENVIKQQLALSMTSCWQTEKHKNGSLSEDPEAREACNQFKVTIADKERTQTLEISMPLLGQHNAYNAAACIAIAKILGVENANIQQVLTSFTGVSGRLQFKTLSFGALIDDTYNANPASVMAGINVLNALNGDSIVCLGAMAELGENAHAEHQALAEFTAKSGVEALFFWHPESVSDYGMVESFYRVDDSKTKFAATFDNHSTFIENLIGYLQRRESNRPVNVLVKGSRSAQMEKVSAALIQAFGE